MGKLTSKGKHIVKVGHHLHINMISKPAIMRRRDKYMILEMLLKVKGQQLKSTFFIYRLIYQNLLVTKNQKSIIDTHTTKKKESKHNTKVSHQITRQGNKRGKKIEKKSFQKQIQNN